MVVQKCQYQPSVQEMDCCNKQEKNCSKGKLAQRMIVAISLPITIPCISILAAAAVPFQVAAQQQEAQKLICLECCMQELHSYGEAEPENPFLEAPEKIIKLIPKLFNFVIEGKSKKPA